MAARKKEVVEERTVHARPELLQVADAVARDKGIEREEVFLAMEMAIQKAGRSKYGHEHDIRAAIDRTNGAISLARYTEVVENVENETRLRDEVFVWRPSAGEALWQSARALRARLHFKRLRALARGEPGN